MATLSASALGTPPFEQPTISKILRNLLEVSFRYRIEDTALKSYEELVRSFENALNGLRLKETPSKDPAHTLLYQRWYRFCYDSKGPRLKLCDCFGKSMLQKFLTLPIPELVKSTNSFLRPEIQGLLTPFLTELRNSLNQPDPFICRKDFAQELQNLRRQQLAARARASQAPNSSKAGSASRSNDSASGGDHSRGNSATDAKGSVKIEKTAPSSSANSTVGAAADASSAESSSSSTVKSEKRSHKRKDSKRKADAVDLEIPSAKKAKAVKGKGKGKEPVSPFVISPSGDSKKESTSSKSKSKPSAKSSTDSGGKTTLPLSTPTVEDKSRLLIVSQPTQREREFIREKERQQLALKTVAAYVQKEKERQRELDSVPPIPEFVYRHVAKKVKKSLPPSPSNPHVKVKPLPPLHSSGNFGTGSVHDVIPRDQKARLEEASGVLKGYAVQNNGTSKAMELLIAAKCLFSKQLPRMPREYILRLVFNREHRTVVLVRANLGVVAAICYRPFKSQGFVEIAFCAVDSGDQVKGYGTHLMNHLKEHVRRQGLCHFLTYADNFAIGYFQKQGFSLAVTFPDEKWRGWIKDYDGGKIMYCSIQPHIPVFDRPGVVAAQRKAVVDALKRVTKSLVVHPGIPQLVSIGNPVALESIPGVKDARTVFRPLPNQEELYEWESLVFQSVRHQPEIWPFLVAVDQEVVPEYSKIISNPIDMSVIEERLERRRFYVRKEIFVGDLRRMTSNAKKFNGEETEFYQAALVIETLVNRLAEMSLEDLRVEKRTRGTGGKSKK